MSEEYKRLPSEIMHIEDEYTAWCIDEALMYMTQRMKDGDIPLLSKGQDRHVTSLKEYYEGI